MARPPIICQEFAFLLANLIDAIYKVQIPLAVELFIQKVDELGKK